MDKQKSDLGFRMMAITFKIRDFFSPRAKILAEVGIQPGWSILDYGCGPGGYIKDAAGLAGPRGKVYALDIHPSALAMVDALGLNNVQTILSDCDTGLESNSLDAVLLYDTFHDLSESYRVLNELHRVLKPGGLLSFSDHHMEENDILESIVNGRFELVEKGEKTYTFCKKIAN